MLLIALATSYALGCVVSAYYLVRIVAGADIRAEGSGTAGARNTLRAHGRALGAAVFLLDAAKGAAAVILAQRLAGTEWAWYLALACAIAGHLWPAQLGFRGGKGAATLAGGLLRADWRVALLTLAIALLIFGGTRRFTRSGLVGTSLVPLVLLATRHGISVAVASMIPACLVLVAHRPQRVRPTTEVSS